LWAVVSSPCHVELRPNDNTMFLPKQPQSFTVFSVPGGLFVSASDVSVAEAYPELFVQRQRQPKKNPPS
jgi:hypothetical protein